jgi:hypothetical protein
MVSFLGEIQLILKELPAPKQDTQNHDWLK